MFAVLKCLRNARNWERVSKMSVIHGSRFVILANWEEVKIYSTTYLLLSAQPCCLSPRRVWLFGCPCHFRKKKNDKRNSMHLQNQKCGIGCAYGQCRVPKEIGAPILKLRNSESIPRHWSFTSERAGPSHHLLANTIVTSPSMCDLKIMSPILHYPGITAPLFGQ